MAVAYKNDLLIPKTIRSLCWSINGDIDLKSNTQYIINQVLAFGDITEIEWLFKNFSRKAIESAFLYSNYNKGLYNKIVLNFLLKFIFKNLKVPEQKYLQMLKKVY